MSAFNPLTSHRVLFFIVQALALTGFLALDSAYADDIRVYSPYVTRGRTEIEFHGYRVQDGSSALNGAAGYDFSLAHGATAWWKPEIYLLQYEREPGDKTKLVGTEFENTFQLAAMGEYWLDPGFLVSYEHRTQAGRHDVLEFGPLLAKRIKRIGQRLNLIWEKQVGAGASGKFEFRAAYSIRYELSGAVQSGLEAYYRPDDDAYQMGPAVSGEFNSSSGLEFEYGLGIIFGINSQAPDTTLETRLEFEF